jgi:hypothetical protein
MPEKISLRINPRNPNHHLWNNQGTWWLHCTIHLNDHTKRRLRRSLQTRDVEEARRRRDLLLIELEAEANRTRQAADDPTSAP